MTETPEGVQFFPLDTHVDHRGELTVLFNRQWPITFDIAQLNFVNSRKNSFRGLHVHATHSDYLCVLKGTLTLGLIDVRKSSTTLGPASLHDLTMVRPRICLIPPSVANGFYFSEDTLYCSGLSHPWDPEEDLGFRWDSPELGIDWPMTDPLLSERDAEAGNLNDLIKLLDKKRH